MCLSRLGRAVEVFHGVGNGADAAKKVVCIAVRTMSSRQLIKDRYVQLTRWDNDPDKVHGEVIKPEIVSFWPTVTEAVIVVVEHACGIV